MSVDVMRETNWICFILFPKKKVLFESKSRNKIHSDFKRARFTKLYSQVLRYQEDTKKIQDYYVKLDCLESKDMKIKESYKIVKLFLSISCKV